MKKLILAFSMLFAVGTASAQAWNGKGDQKVQVGLNGWGYGTGITGSYDYGLGKIVSVGAGANVYFDGYKDNNKDNNFFVFGRVGFHLQEPLNLPSQWDIYPGVNLGLLGSDFGIGAHLGVRYFFNNKVGIYGEFGNNGSLGVSINF
ncbi:hypothetical protein BPO_1554 [Bergeyella porcorum]|uniref:Outer membrane protein beta-barrel domain-containing protein n=1 Tax=Bergeyella porcorum TaxID=1735111 RepID=A0AAU0F2A7_9FLAO